MPQEKEIISIKALVFLKSISDINTFSKELCLKLNLPNFREDFEQDPPHEVIYLSEVLGLELELRESNEKENFSFVLYINSSNSFEEIFNDKVFDFSPWFAKYISEICDIEATCI